MKSLIEKPKPGQFKAFCKKGRWVLLAEVLTWPSDEQPDAVNSRWDRKAGGEVVEVRCTFETTDRALFVEHMKTVHGRTIAAHITAHRGHSALSSARWRGPRLTEDGLPWLDKDGRTRTCSRCGLIDEIGHTLASERWWGEHVSMCAEAEPVAS